MRIVTEAGPGAYEKSVEVTKITGGVIGREKRHLTENNPTPGPVKYIPHFDQFFEKPAKTVFGKEERLKRSQSSTPGPGYYSYSTGMKSKITLGRQTRKVNRTSI